jgi:nucleotide-binding universal stress UspA family protein
MPRTLVVGCDGSGCANKAVDAAVELAHELGDELLIVFGYDPGGYGEEHKAHREAVRQVGERVVADALKRAAAAGVSADVALVPKRPVEALLDAAEERDARAIVVGSHGEQPLKAAILGSTPHKLLQVSQRPVLVVPAA